MMPGVVRVVHSVCTVVKDFVYSVNSFGKFEFSLEERLNGVSSKFEQDNPGMTPEGVIIPGLKYKLDFDFYKIKMRPNRYALFLLNCGHHNILTHIFGDDLYLKGHSSFFGPVFNAPWDIYGDNHVNLEKALTRVCSMRESGTDEDNTDYDNRLRDSNNFFFNMRRVAKYGARAVFQRKMLGIRKRIFHKLKGMGNILDDLIAKAYEPHTKMRIRVEAMNEILAQCKLHTLFCDHVSGKLKLFERAKPGKYPRLIGDFSTPGSLLCGLFAEVAKSCFVDLDDGVCDFDYVKSADTDTLNRIFRKIDGKKDWFAFFSDDSLGMFKGRIFETDISSCDMSNDREVFECVHWLFADFPTVADIMRRGIKQCKLPLHVYKPGTKKRKKVVLKPVRPIEFSGTTLTTLLNNIASLGIGCCISRKIRMLKRAPEAQDVVLAAEECGYKLTVDVRDRIETCSLLKHFPYRDEDGKIQSCMCVAPLLRGFGTCDLDLPTKLENRNGKVTLTERIRAWNTSTLLGYVHSGLGLFTTPLLKANFTVDRVITPTREFKFMSRVEAPLSAFCNRYSVPPDVIQDFILLLDKACEFTVVNHRFIHIINKMDYGLSAT